MTEELKAIKRTAEWIALNNPFKADEYEACKIKDYLASSYFLIPEEDWDEIEASGYDVELWREEADDWHVEEASAREEEIWFATIYNNLLQQPIVNGKLVEFWRGYPAGTEVEYIKKGEVYENYN
jgi:hypothetical protein